MLFLETNFLCLFVRSDGLLCHSLRHNGSVSVAVLLSLPTNLDRLPSETKVGVSVLMKPQALQGANYNCDYPAEGRDDVVLLHQEADLGRGKNGRT